MEKRTRSGWLAAAASCLIAPGAGAGVLDLRLNEIQVLGTHNSYHVQPVPELIDIYVGFDSDAIYWEYTHRPLEEQLELLGIRQFELDVWADPEGGLFAEPLGLEALEGMVVHLPELDPPGMKVQHVIDLDFVSSCPFLVECLEILKAWSDAHPAHVPILVLIEVKDDPPPNIPAIPFQFPLPFGPAEFDDLDAEIRSVFPPEQLVTPDDVRGSRASLDQAVRKDGWPTLREARGKLLFALDNGGQKLDDYVAGHPALSGRVMFTDSPPGSPEAGFVKLNDPVTSQKLIPKLVRQGYVIRTRADADTIQARTGYGGQRDYALRSGAQWVSTDYPELGPFGTDYLVELPGGGPARCNPVSAPNKCRDGALEVLEGERPLAGQRLSVRDPGDPSRRRIALRTADALLDSPLPGSADDPSLAGATLELSNPDTLESAVFALPAGASWQGRGQPAGIAGWTYRDPAGTSGPCTLLEVRNGSVLRALCSGAAIPFSLDEASQGQLFVTLRLGAGDLHCLHFGGKLTRDVPGTFTARAAPPNGCPI
jgi:hypothetical protein